MQIALEVQADPNIMGLEHPVTEAEKKFANGSARCPLYPGLYPLPLPSGVKLA
jgi:hypothetical protein